MKKKRVWIFVLIPLAVLTVLATALVARAATPGATVKLSPYASLANPPNSVIVSLDYSCLPSQFSFGSVSVDQSQIVGGASGARVDVFGYGNFTPTCDDKSHKANVVVSSFSFYGGPGYFTPGSASASAFVASGAAYANTTAELSIK